MEEQEVTLRSRLVAKSCDSMGYQNYVFENLDIQDPEYKYIMCVRFPNWNQKTFNINEEGFVTLKYVQAGISKWFDGTEFQVYKYTNIIFMKFIPLIPNINPTEVFVD